MIDKEFLHNLPENVYNIYYISIIDYLFILDNTYRIYPIQIYPLGASFGERKSNPVGRYMRCIKLTAEFKHKMLYFDYAIGDDKIKLSVGLNGF